MSGFNTDLCKFLYNRVQDEADAGCQALREPGPKSWTVGDIEEHNIEEYFQKFTSNFPILMTCLTAVTCKGRSWEENFTVAK